MYIVVNCIEGVIVMTKSEKAQKIKSYLCSGDDKWLSYDSTLKGCIGFKVDGLARVIKISSYSSVTSGYEEVVREVKNAGLDHGRCLEVVDNYLRVARERRESFEQLRRGLNEVFEEKVQQRVDKALQEQRESSC